MAALTTQADSKVEIGRSSRYEPRTYHLADTNTYTHTHTQTHTKHTHTDTHKQTCTHTYFFVVGKIDHCCVHFDIPATANVDGQSELEEGMSGLLMLWSGARRLLNIIINRLISYKSLPLPPQKN